MENKQTMIEVQDLCKSFHKLEVLKHISTTFYKNEVVSIIGPSGGGKSTFLRCLNLAGDADVRARSSSTAWISAQATEHATSTCTARRWAWCFSISISSRNMDDPAEP